MLEWQTRFDEAEAVLGEGLAACPQDVSQALHRLHIVTARFGKDPTAPDRAKSYLEEMRARFPDSAEGYAYGVRIYNRIGQHREADELATSFLQRWPNSAELQTEYAKSAEERNELAEAEARYTALKNKHPKRHDGYLGAARAAAALGRVDAAEDLLREAMSAVHWIPAPFLEFAALAGRRGDWEQAVMRWKDALKRFPGDASIAHNLNNAQLALLGAGGELDSSTNLNRNRGDVAEMMMQFESLGGGDGQGCEFGLVQRDLGAEPLGLLRWTSVETDDLIGALDADFAGMGEPEQTVPEIHQTGRAREYFLKDTKYNMIGHSGVAPDDLAIDKAAAVFKRRLKFLANKLIGDLREAEKIFVYRKVTRDLADEEVDRLHAAIRRHGDGTLLYVRYADESHPNGSVEWARPGLLIGNIDQFAFSRSMERLGASTRSWLEICRNAHSLWQTSRAS